MRISLPRRSYTFSMFATIHTISQPENFWGKIKYNLLPPPVKAEKVEVAGSSGFLKLTVPIVRGKIYWNNVRSVAGNALQNTLLPAHVPLKEQVNLRRFRSDRFESILCINSFLKLLSLLPQKQLLKECAVIDFAGAFPSALVALPRYCRTLKVITANPERYEPLAHYCMEEYGTALYLSESIAKAFASPIVLFPKRAAIPTAFSRTSLVFAASAENLYTARLLVPEGTNLPQKYLSLMPPGIAPQAFAAALYEVSGLSELSRSVSPAFRQNNLILSYQDVISMLDY